MPKDDELRPRDVLAANLKKLMEASASLRTVDALVQAGAGTNGTIDRIRRKESATGVDNLAPIAKVFGMSDPWALLVPGLVAEPTPEGLPQIKGLPDWPFERIKRERYTSLEPEDKAFVQGQLIAAIQQCEQGRPAKPEPKPASKPISLPKSELPQTVKKYARKLHRKP